MGERDVIRPAQLASNAGDPQQYISDPAWGMSQKIDGFRLLIKNSPTEAASYNRHGAATPYPWALIGAFANLPEGTTLDGELIEFAGAAEYHIFDVLEVFGNSIRTLPLRDRTEILKTLYPEERWRHGKGGDYLIRPVPLWTTAETKHLQFKNALESNLEGVIFKKLDAPYVLGRSKNFLKYKFVKELDCVVTARGTDIHNLSLGLWDGKEYVHVGNISSLTGDGPDIRVGDVVKVQCLYVSDNGHLVQPVTPMLRTDKAPHECLIDQLEPLKTRKSVIWI